MNGALRHEIDLAVGEVVRNVTNFPERAQFRLLGQDMAPLRETIVAKIEERIDGAAHFAAVTAPLSNEERSAVTPPISLIEQIEELLRQAERYAGSVSGIDKRFVLLDATDHNDAEAAEYALNAISRAVTETRARTPLTDEDRIEAAARSIANLKPGEPWPSNDDLGGHPMLGTRDDEYRDGIRDTARAALKAAGVIA